MKIFKKISAIILCTALIFNFNVRKTRAVFPDIVTLSAVITIGGMLISGYRFVIDERGKILKVRSENFNQEVFNRETDRYKGVRPIQDTTRMITDIVAGNSLIKVFGQATAKDQCLDALSGCIENIYAEIAGTRNPVDKRGNVVYIIGDSGTGKTTMGKAIANALLKYSDKTCFFIDSSQINRDQSLGEQLFRTTSKVANLRNVKSVGKKDEFQIGVFDAKVTSPMLDHIFRWGEYGAIVIIDEFEKMKAVCTSPQALGGYEDKSADEILKSIAANGYYMVGAEKVYCGQVLFIVITNEKKEQLYENFGQGGAKGGGVQRLNIIEFEQLDKDCCKRIINDTVESIKIRLTNPLGDYKIRHVKFSEETLDNMANYVFNDKLKQGRAKNDLEQKIFRLFLFELENNVNKSFEIKYTPSVEKGKIGIFSKTEIVVPELVAEDKREEEKLRTQIQTFVGLTSVQDFLKSK